MNEGGEGLGVQEDCLRSTVYRKRDEGGGVGGKIEEGEEGEDERGSSRGPEGYLISFFLFPGGLDGGLKMDGG